MGERDAQYRLTDLIELDDALVGGRRSGGKRGRGAEGKTPILVAVENRGERAGFVAIEVTPSVRLDTVKGFVERHIAPDQFVRSDALGALKSVAETRHHAPRVTPLAKAGGVAALGACRDRQPQGVLVGDLPWRLTHASAGVSQRVLLALQPPAVGSTTAAPAAQHLCRSQAPKVG